MRPETAFEMGYQSAAAGFFFDGMELIAAVGPDAGGIDVLDGAVELLFMERDEVNDQMRFLTDLVSAAFSSPHEVPTGVDAYRWMLTERVFEIVNRWSYIADIQQVNRLQAWFYAGFGLGRGRTVILGLGMCERLRERAPQSEALKSVPDRLGRLAAEGARQMETAAGEDDLRRVRPLFEDVAARLDRVAWRLAAADAAWPEAGARGEDLEVIASTLREIRVDFRTRAHT